MGTKSNPGEFDCYAKLADDEPYLTLRAKDPVAAKLVQAWRYLRSGDFREASIYLEQAFSMYEREVEEGRREWLPLGSPKSQEARKCSDDMLRWFIDNVRDRAD